MGRPQYPTKEGIWSGGKRKEEIYNDSRLGMPYTEAVENFRKATQGRDDFDPAVVFVWGTLQAKAVLTILKSVEETFGTAGQQTVRKAINKIGYEATEELLESCTFPQDVEEIELISFFVTAINTVLYASLERPWITSQDRCEFDILWCPHQDTYTAFDCRVQRYFVEGIFQAMEDRGLARATALVDKLIPQGAEYCHFVVDRLKDVGGNNPWHDYSDELGRRALEKIKEQK